MDERHRRSVTISARTVNDAIAEAERQLGVPVSNLDITIISHGARGFLGMGAEQARILALVRGALEIPAIVSPSSDDEESDEDDEYLDDDVEAEAEDADEPDDEPEGERAEHDTLDTEDTPSDHPSISDDELAVVAATVARDLLERMGLQATVRVREGEGGLTLDIEANNSALLIGRHGDTLAALQYLVNVVVGRKTHHYTKIVLDVEGYRTRREDTLRTMALRQADRVRRYQREITLTDMPARERRIVHLALQDLEDISTYSVGEEPHRRVVIAPRLIE